MQAGGSVTALAYATAEKVDPGWLTCTAVDTERLSDCVMPSDAIIDRVAGMNEGGAGQAPGGHS